MRFPIDYLFMQLFEDYMFNVLSFSDCEFDNISNLSNFFFSLLFFDTISFSFMKILRLSSTWISSIFIRLVNKLGLIKSNNLMCFQFWLLCCVCISINHKQKKIEKNYKHLQVHHQLFSGDA